MKPDSSIQVVRMWCRIHTDPVLEYFNNPEGLSCGNLLVGMVPKRSNWLMV
jgi:hypothetical protein